LVFAIHLSSIHYPFMINGTLFEQKNFQPFEQLLRSFLKTPICSNG